MAALLYEIRGDCEDPEIRVIPGITAAVSGAALAGAPLTHDFAVISLSDRLTPWETIRARLPLARQVWRYVTGEWLDHGEKCPEIARLFAGKAGSAVYNLVEDGLFEREIPLPVALFAEALWDPFRPWRDILRETAQRPDISMT